MCPLGGGHGLMGRAVDTVTVPRPPAEAMELWTDLDRWPAFIDGFARTVQVDPSWPKVGAELVWQSTRGGRGRVVERVESYEAPPPGPEVALQSHPGRLVTRVAEEALTGEQTVTFAPAPEGARVELALEYELARAGPLGGLTDVLFIRRALRDALRRTLGRFAGEAENLSEEPGAGRR